VQAIVNGKGVHVWFTDPTDPSTLVALLVEAALLGLAVAVAFFDILVRPARRLALTLAALGAVIGLGVVASAVWEAWTLRYPLVLPNAPAGTYAQPTLLMLLGVLVNGLLMTVAGVLSFRRPGVAGLLFVAVAGQIVFSVLRSRAVDPTFPPGNVGSAIVAAALPSLVVGALLLASWWADKRKKRPSARPSGQEGKLHAARRPGLQSELARTGSIGRSHPVTS
jgi:hypothetical protein